MANPLARRLDKLEGHGVDADRAAGEALMAAIRAGRDVDHAGPTFHAAMKSLTTTELQEAIAICRDAE